MAETLNRFPTEPTKPLTAPREQWYSQLVRMVNQLLSDAVNLAALIAANTAAIALLQPTYGTWTPIDTSGAGLVFANPEGYYTKIGKFVHVQAFLQYPVTVNGATASIGGVPFVSFDTTNSTNAGPVGYSNSGLALGAVLANNTTNVTFANFATGVNVTNGQLTGTTLVFAVSYRATT